MKRKHILYLGLTLLISIVGSIIFEYYPTISNTFTFFIVSFIFILLSFLSFIFLLFKDKKQNPSLFKTRSALDKIALLLVITEVEILIIRVLFMVSFFYSAIFIIFVIGVIYLIFKDYDFSEFFTAICIILCLCLLFSNLFPKKVEDYSTTRGEAYIIKQKELTLFSNGKYTIYNTTADYRDKEVRDLPFDVNDPFAQYILKNINKDLKVVLTHYDKEQHTYKIMYEDESIQIFKLEDVKMDKELATDSVLKFLESLEKETKEVAEKKKLKEQANKLINS